MNNNKMERHIKFFKQFKKEVSVGINVMVKGMYLQKKTDTDISEEINNILDIELLKFINTGMSERIANQWKRSLWEDIKSFNKQEFKSIKH